MKVEAEDLRDVATLRTGTALDDALGTVGDAMTRNVVTLEVDMRASDAAVALDREGVTGAPVVRDWRVVGVISLRDLMERSGVHGPPHTKGSFLRVDRLLVEHTVADFMTKEVAAVRPATSLAAAVVVMDEARVNRLPVIDTEGRPIGILAREDVIRAIADRARDHLREVTKVEGAPSLEPD